MNPVVSALSIEGRYVAAITPRRHHVACPWCSAKGTVPPNAAVYDEPDESSALGRYRCASANCKDRRIGDLIEFLGISSVEARHRPIISIVDGQLHEVIDAAEQVLAERGQHYQSGGLIVSVSVDAVTGDPALVPTRLPALLREFSDAAAWQKRAKGGWVLTDPPQRHIQMLHDGQTYRHLKPLKGVARQPYYREADGQLVCTPGYEEAAQIMAVFDPVEFALSPATRDGAEQAISELKSLLGEFRFVGQEDQSAALAAIFTAVTRPTLPHAPAFHVQAPVYGSGKTYLCELIGAFAGPKHNTKISYPTTSEEATKALLSVLLPGPAVVEFDDMDTDWIPHGTIKRMLTAESISDRILGHSKTATVGTRTLFLGSGNNVGPVRDLLRRVLTIHLDTREATPATLSYSGSPVELVRNRRGYFVSLVLTIIEAWKAAGSPKGNIPSIASYSGPWSDYCRHPLVWLGEPDPASSLIEQVQSDPDGEALHSLMSEWYAVYGQRTVTVRKVVDELSNHPHLFDAIREFPLVEREGVNNSKFGWFLRKHANRIVRGLEFRKGAADGRTGWCVVSVASQPTLAGLAVKQSATHKPQAEANDYVMDDELPF